MQSTNLTEIDGSLFEGGGQIIRNSMALSNILQKPFFIKNIRKSRPKPGLNNQLISAIILMKEISKATVEGDKMFSESLYFYPKKITSGVYKNECFTAASITLMTQSLIPTLIYGKKLSTVTLKGGTLVSKSPPSSSISNILNVMLKQMGCVLDFEIVKEGFYPKGGGIAKLQIQPIYGCLKNIEMLEKSRIIKVNVEIFHYVDKLPVKDITKECKKGIKKLLNTQKNKIINHRELEDEKFPNEAFEDKQAKKFEIDVTIRELNMGKKQVKLSTYCVVFQAFGEADKCFFDCSVYPETNISVEKCLDEVLSKFEEYLKEDTTLDEYHQDQLLIYMALADGISKIKIGKKITNHTRAVLYVLEKFIPEAKIQIKECEDKSGNLIIEVQGVSLKNIN